MKLFLNYTQKVIIFNPGLRYILVFFLQRSNVTVSGRSGRTESIMMMCAGQPRVSSRSVETFILFGLFSNLLKGRGVGYLLLVYLFS